MAIQLTGLSAFTFCSPCHDRRHCHLWESRCDALYRPPMRCSIQPLPARGACYRVGDQQRLTGGHVYCCTSVHCQALLHTSELSRTHTSTDRHTWRITNTHAITQYTDTHRHNLCALHMVLAMRDVTHSHTHTRHTINVSSGHSSEERHTPAASTAYSSAGTAWQLGTPAHAHTS